MNKRGMMMFELTVFLFLLFPAITIAKSIDDVRNDLRRESCIEYLETLDTDDLISLAKNIYFEARGESLKGQLAVAFVTLNRVLSRRYPNTITEVVYQKNQFSWTKKRNRKITDKNAWNKSLKVAKLAISLFVDSLENNELIMKGSCFYHHKRINPSWSRKMIKIVNIDNHIFYTTNNT